MLRLVVISTLVSFLSGCGGGLAVKTQQSTVQATGKAEITYNQVGRARDDALQDAKRQAVAIALGSVVSSSTEISAGQFQEQRILSNAEGYIESYSILAEGKQGGSIYSVTIAAVVQVGKIRNVVDQALSNAGRPEFIVLVNQDGPLKNKQTMQVALEQAFIAEGYPILDRATVEQLKLKNTKLIAGILGGDAKAAQNFGQMVGAQVVIAAQAHFKNGGKVLNSNLNSMQLVSSVRIIDASNGRVLAAAQADKTVPHINPEIGGSKAADKAAYALVQRTSPEILKRWQPNSARPVELTVTGLTYGELIEFKDLLLTMRGVKEVNTRGLKQKVAKMQVMFQGKSETLSQRIYQTAKTSKLFETNIIEVAPGNIVLQAKRTG